MELMLAVFSGLTVAVTLLAVFQAQPHAAIDRRLGRMTEDSGADTPLALPFAERMVYPAARRVLAVVPAPHRLADTVRRRLEQAGNPTTTTKFCTVWAGSGIVLPGVFALLLLAGKGSPDRGALLGVAAVTGIGIYVPWTWLRRNAAARKKAIAKTLPDAIDLLITNVEAGLGLQSALLAVADKAKGPLAEEFGRVVREVSVGRPRPEALADMGARLDLPEARLFARAMIQAEQTGIPIARVLRNHSHEMRERRRVLARDRAAKLPVKMVVATVAFMFPTLFMLMLGPVVLNVIGYFSKS